jgi:hypothetical protein
MRQKEKTMQVDLKLTFSEEEILVVCLKRCDSIETPVPGHFEAAFGPYSWERKVTVTFVPRDQEEAVEAPPVPVPVAIAYPFETVA